MVRSGWAWWDQGAYDLVGLVTGYLVICFQKESEEKSGSRSGYCFIFLPCQLFISPVKVEFSLYTVPLSFGVFFLSFPVSESLKKKYYGQDPGIHIEDIDQYYVTDL